MNIYQILLTCYNTVVTLQSITQINRLTRIDYNTSSDLCKLAEKAREDVLLTTENQQQKYYLI